MKKTILSFLLMFVTMATFASRWTVTGEYSDRFVVYTQVNINGLPRSQGVEVAAFIDGQVRGVADASNINENGHLTLEVWGNNNNNNNDNGKTVTFKIAYNNLVYKSTKTLSYQHQSTQTPIPFVLNVDAITGVKLPETLELTQKIGATYDLTSDITFLYEPLNEDGRPALNEDGTPAQYTMMNETTLDTDVTPLSYEWEFENSSSFFEVGENNVLTVNGFCENKYLGLRVYGPLDQSIMTFVAQFEVSTSTNVTIIEPTIPVTGIELSQSTITMNVGESAFNYLSGIVTVLPEDATNRMYSLVPNDAAAAAGVGGAEDKYTAKIPGTYSFKVVSDQNPNIFKNLTIIVVQLVELIQWKALDEDPVVNIWVGDNAFTEIANNVKVMPENATNKTLTYSCDDARAFNESGVAMKKGSFRVRVGAVDAVQGLNPLSVTVNVKQPVESITAEPKEISVYVGDDVYSYILEKVNIEVLPETADDRSYTVRPVANDAISFPDYIASTEGIYTWEVVSNQNPEVKTNITVNVLTPVSFTVPESIELTLMTPGQGAITDITGDGFDASLITFEGQGDYADISLDEKNNIIVVGKKLGDGEFEVYYNGKSMGVTAFKVGAEIKLESGWNWMSNYTASSIALKQAGSTDYITEYFTGSNMIKEARSQTDLLYNDTEKYGAFGTIEEFNPNTMYKVNMAGPRSFYPESTELTSSVVRIVTKGYTWINYPIVGNHSMEYFNNQAKLEGFNGCVIMGKDGFAEYNNGKWVASGNFKMETGKGYIFYMPEAGTLTLNFGESYVDEGTPANAKALSSSANVWKYDTSQFADNMAIVAKVNGIEASSRYSVGAFVGEECRGMGQFVTDDVMFINVAGIAGEKVNFRLYDSEAGCYSDILESMNYTIKRGSLSSPVTLTPESTVTGIMNVESSMQNSTKAFNVNGQQVNGNAKGLLIIGGKKVVKK